ncbi:MAG: putative DNA binding domain-containing protein [Lentisphaeria bacterium]|nr:putative DNA binding domain-containing protein [Lentisphaeria bacterium]
MNTTTEQIDIYLKETQEDHNLEFKGARNSFAIEDLYKYCVALANEGGGKLILGITDKKPRKVVGSNAFKDIAETEKKILDTLRISVLEEVCIHPQGRVVIFHIPSRTVGCAYSYRGQFLMRSGASLVAMTDDRLRMIHAEGKQHPLEDPAMIGISPQKIVDLLDTQKFFELLNKPYPSKRDGVIEALLNRKLIDSCSSGYSIRKIGALLLAKNLNHFESIKFRAPRVIVYSGTNKLKTKLDQIEIYGYAVGFEGLIHFIMSQLPQNEVITAAIRKKVQLVPETVIRKLVANALVHQDFNLSGIECLIEIYENRIEISNPGIPLLETDRFIDENQCRNERLADMLRLFGICEVKGSGWDKIVTYVEAAQLAAPDFRVTANKTSVVLSGYKTFQEMTRTDRIRACYQHVALRYVMHEAATNQTLRDRFKLPEDKASTISAVMGQAVKESKIKVDEAAGGGRKYARYLPYWA